MIYARRERDSLAEKLAEERMGARSFLDDVARATGMRINRESFACASSDARKTKVIARIKRLLANASGEPRGPNNYEHNA